MPLEGYYRPGRFMPVRVKVQGERNSILLRATGAMPTSLLRSGDGEAIAPWLMVESSVHGAQWLAGGKDHPIEPDLHSLNDNEKLVGAAGVESRLADTIFPGFKVIV